MSLRVINIGGDAQGLTFRPVYQTHYDKYGQVPNNFGSPYWAFRADFIPLKGLEAREFEAALDEGEGIHILGIYDYARLYPWQHQEAIENGASETIVKEVLVKGMSRANSTLSLQIPPGETVTVGDPIAFKDAFGITHYFRVGLDATMTGTGTGLGDIKAVKVKIRPRYDLSSVTIAATRIRPRCLFQVDLNEDSRQTGSGRFTTHNLSGFEYFGAISE
ncbi:hypothetical protein [Litorimonas haliclonae]|uniref:hypothetical protein n=1 Tax=Litorimonas haliclonae TaxID=2081977 RepID=UPI0039EDEA8D